MKNFVILLLLLVCGALAALLFWNASAPGSAVTPLAGPRPEYDVRLTIAESYLERRVQEQILGAGNTTTQNVNIDVLPDDLVRAEGTVTVFGFEVPVSVTLRVVVSEGRIRTEAMAGEAGPVQLPPTVLTEVQEAVNLTLAEAAPLGGSGLQAVGVESDDRNLVFLLAEPG